MRVARKLSGPVLGIFSLSFMMALAGCGSTTPATLAPLTVTPGATTVVVPQDGTPATLAVTISPLNSTVTVTVYTSDAYVLNPVARFWQRVVGAFDYLY